MIALSSSQPREKSKTSCAVAWPRLARSKTDWSSSRFSRRSTAQTCQSGARSTTDRASGAKYAALAEVPGLRTRTFLAVARPNMRTPTRSRRDGVPFA